MQSIWQRAEIFIGCTDTPICLAVAAMVYMAKHGNDNGLFVCLVNGDGITKRVFVTKVHQALQQVGLPQQLFAGYSFRVGATKAAANDHRLNYSNPE